MGDKGLRKAVFIGALVGACASLGASLSMDLFFSDMFQGTWRDAAAKDVASLFGPDCGKNYFAVTLVLVAVMGFLAAFGSLLGAAAGLLVNRFFKILLK